MNYEHTLYPKGPTEGRVSVEYPSETVRPKACGSAAIASLDPFRCA